MFLAHSTATSWRYWASVSSLPSSASHTPKVCCTAEGSNLEHVICLFWLIITLICLGSSSMFLYFHCWFCHLNWLGTRSIYPVLVCSLLLREVHATLLVNFASFWLLLLVGCYCCSLSDQCHQQMPVQLVPCAGARVCRWISWQSLLGTWCWLKMCSLLSISVIWLHYLALSLLHFPSMCHNLALSPSHRMQYRHDGSSVPRFGSCCEQLTLGPLVGRGLKLLWWGLFYHNSSWHHSHTVPLAVM